MDGQIIVLSVIGPLAHSPSDVDFFMAALLGVGPWNRDPEVLSVPWRIQAPTERLCFGLLKWDEAVMPHPPVRRALQETAAKLKI